jgi:hypothetical protein
MANVMKQALNSSIAFIGTVISKTKLPGRELWNKFGDFDQDID